MTYKNLLLAVCSAAALAVAMPEASALENTPDTVGAVYFVSDETGADPLIEPPRALVARDRALKPRVARAARNAKARMIKADPPAPAQMAQLAGAPQDNPSQALTPQSAQPDPTGDAHVQMLRARAQLGLGQLGEARRTAEGVLAANPNDVDALRILATVEESAARWRHAATAWDRVYRVSNDPAAQRRRDEILRAYGSNVTGSAFFEGALGADEQYGGRVAVQYRPLDGPEWAVLLENRHAEDDVATLLDGTVTSVSIDRQRLEVGVGDALRWGRVSARAIITNDVAGGRAGVGATWGGGSIDLTVGYNEPYWLFSEGMINEATTDYAALAGSGRWGRVGARAAVRSSTYGVADDDKIASSVRYTAGLEVSLSGGVNPFVVSYIVDGESYDDIDVRQRVNLTTYTPMPFFDREVHSIGLYKTFGDTQHSFANLGAGYRADRYGAEGPFASVWAEQEITDRVSLGARVEYSKPSIRGASESESWGYAEIYLRRRF